jgi:Tfp pilus assembly protein PilX
MSTLQATAARLPARVAPRRGERGVVMFVALVVLIVMTLAGLAMLRQMSSGVSIAGNIAFKQGATAVADAGIEAGRAWLTAAPTLDADVPANGYYATWVGNVDPTSADWTPMWNAVPDALVTNSGSVRWIVQRLCALPGPSSGGAQQCSDSVPTSGGGGSKGGGSYGDTPTALTPTPFYRVTARVVGPRNTVSYTQVVLN